MILDRNLELDLDCLHLDKSFKDEIMMKVEEQGAFCYNVLLPLANVNYCKNEQEEQMIRYYYLLFKVMPFEKTVMENQNKKSPMVSQLLEEEYFMHPNGDVDEFRQNTIHFYPIWNVDKQKIFQMVLKEFPNFQESVLQKIEQLRNEKENELIQTEEIACEEYLLPWEDIER